MKSDCSENVQCANVRTLGSAQPHITSDSRTDARASSAQTSLKALAGAVLSRTSPRTLAAHCAETPRTLPADPKAIAHIARWAWLVVFNDHALETYHHPDATLAEVQRKYPDAVLIEPLPEAMYPRDPNLLTADADLAQPSPVSSSRHTE